jgi:hypothetical protein
MMYRWALTFGVCLVLAAGRSARADDRADMKKLLAQAIKASGDPGKLARSRAATLKFKGTTQVTGTDIPFDAEWTLQYPNQHKLTVNAKVSDNDTYSVAVVINKDKGWIKLNNGKTIALGKGDPVGKEQLYVLSLATLLPLKDKSFKLRPVGEIKVGEKDAVGVKITCKGHRDVNLYFDKKTHHLLKCETTVKDMGTDKEVTEETTYSGFKKMDGVLCPTKMLIQRDGKKYADVELTEYKLEEKLDDSEFGKP